MQQGLTCPRKAERAFCHLFQNAGSNFLAKRWNCPYRLNDRNPRDSSHYLALCKESRQNSAKEREVSQLPCAALVSEARNHFRCSARLQNERGVWGILTPSHPWRLYQDEPERERGVGYLNAESSVSVISGWTEMREIWVQNSIFVTRTAS